MDRKKILSNLLNSVLELVDPVRMIPKQVRLSNSGELLVITGTDIPLPGTSALYIIGSGKASASMAAATETLLGDRIEAGCVISSPKPLHSPKSIQVLTGSHPYPDHHSFEATEELLRFIGSIPPEAAVLNLISGGTSSLLCKPAGEITPEELSQTYRMLIASGADIGEINTVRKACSMVKGGQLLEQLSCREVIDLIISDVPDDNPADIGSGPTTPQPITPADALSVVERYGLDEKLPKSVIRHIKKSRQRTTEPLEGTTHRQFILSSATIVSAEAEELFSERGFQVTRETNVWNGPVTGLEKKVTGKLDELNRSVNSPAVHIWYGESTVEVSGEGKGGRNQELALRMGIRLAESGQKAAFLSAGTDGIDGPTDVAGAVVDQTSIPEIESETGRSAADFLKRNDSYHYFEGTACHIKTGPTGNNVMDLQFLMTGNPG